MESKLLLSLILFFSFWIFLGFSQAPTNCLPKVYPCQNYIKSATPPPATCCLPLTDMIAHDPQCLCGIYSNVALLKSFNVTQKDIVKLPEKCGVKGDISKCSQVAPTPADTPTALPNGHTPNNSTSNSATKILESGLFGGSSSIALIASLIISAFHVY